MYVYIYICVIDTDTDIDLQADPRSRDPHQSLNYVRSLVTSPSSRASSYSVSALINVVSSLSRPSSLSVSSPGLPC